MNAPTIDLCGETLTPKLALASITVALMDIAELMTPEDKDVLESAANLTRGVRKRIVMRETKARINADYPMA